MYKGPNKFYFSKIKKKSVLMCVNDRPDDNLVYYPSISFETGSLIDLKLPTQANLAGQSSGICLPLPPQHQA